MQPVRSASLPLGPFPSGSRCWTFEPGAVLVGAGTGPPIRLVVESGAVAVWAAVARGGRGLLEVLGQGDVISSVGVCDVPSGFRPEVVALTRSVIRSDPALLDRPMSPALLARRIGELQRSLARALCLRVPERVLDLLTCLAARFGTAVAGGRRIELPLSQDLLAAMVGATRETVNRALRSLASEGAVRRVGRTYVVCTAPSRNGDQRRRSHR